MPIRSGIASQIGVAAESSYGTAVTVTRFYEFESEALDIGVQKIYNTALGLGRFQRHDRITTYPRGGGGTVVLPVMTKGFGLIFQHMLGQNTVGGAGDDKTHVCIPDADALYGKSLTVQKGVPGVDGTVRAITFEGGKITNWELNAAIDQLLKLTATFDFERHRTPTFGSGAALASATYPSANRQLTFVEGTLEIDSTPLFVRGAKVAQNNALKVDRHGLGNVKREPLANGISDITGELEAEFEDLAMLDAWANGDVDGALVLEFDSGVEIGSTGNNFGLTVTIPAIEYTGTTPKVGGPDVVMQPLPFKALKNASDPIITLAYVTSDTAA